MRRDARLPAVRASVLATALGTALVLAGGCRQDATPPGGGGGGGVRSGTPDVAPTPVARDGETWTKTASGLEYQVLTPGKDGKSPSAFDTVSVDYKGWLENGKVFDSSYARGAPAEFQVGGVIAGWTEALQKMTPGAKWKLRIPPQLGYGPGGAPPDIPGNATLYFEVELHSVIPFKEPPPRPGMPAYVAPNPEAQKTTASGLKYEVLKEGDGTPPTETTPMELRYAFFNQEGKLVDCSEIQGTIKLRPVDLNLPFLKEGTQLMKPGAVYRFEVPPALAFGAQSPHRDVPPNSTVHWDIELIRLLTPLPVPPFETVDESKFEKRPSGLLVQQIKAGEGTPPKLGQKVVVHYVGWFPDGNVFDSSYPRGDPATFQLGTVIQGWNEGVQLMKPGGVARFVIPANLGYGAEGRPGIPANSTLIFQIELISIGK